MICEDKDLIFEEAPQAYKNIEFVIGDLVAAGLVELAREIAPCAYLQDPEAQMTAPSSQCWVQISAGQGPDECALS